MTKERAAAIRLSQEILARAEELRRLMAGASQAERMEARRIFEAEKHTVLNVRLAEGRWRVGSGSLEALS